MGQGASRLAYRMLGDERGVSRRGVRYPWWRSRSDLSASRERTCPVALRAWHLKDGELLDAQRLPAGRRREDEQVRRQLRDDPGVAGDEEFWWAEVAR